MKENHSVKNHSYEIKSMEYWLIKLIVLHCFCVALCVWELNLPKAQSSPLIFYCWATTQRPPHNIVTLLHM